CTECGKRFRLKINLIIHQRSHAKEGPYECAVCEISFTDRHHLDLHQSIHIKDRAFGAKGRGKSYICSDCGKSFVCHSWLVRHQMTHTGERPYKCSECDKSYRRKDYLLKHQRQH
ncbi:ZN777 protein, partial [Arenaria interpres]|nr:ZN777 protein [Arenaria interpres]